MKVVFVGSGAFGVPTLRAIAQSPSHDLLGVITKPAKLAGRGQKIRQTPVFDAANEHGLDLLTPDSINDNAGQKWLDEKAPDALVVIAYERLLSSRVLSGRFACNLHASLLPRWRGAAPIHRAVLAGDQQIGASVIELASSMDSGAVYARKGVPRDPLLTTGDWHDRMANWGPDLVIETLNAFATGSLTPIPQDPALATHAKKLSKSEGVFDPHVSSELALAQIHGLDPWPRCSASIAGVRVQLRRGKMGQSGPTDTGLLDESGQLRCHDGWIQVIEVQPESRNSMSFRDFARGLPCDWPQPVQGV